MTPLSIRTATEQDSARVVALSEEFSEYLRREHGDTTEGHFNEAAYLRDGFGPEPAFSCLVAERERRVVGYLVYHFGYDIDAAARTLYIADLFVSSAARGQGVGRALMNRLQAIGRQAGAAGLIWSVYTPNASAQAFYERLGAQYIDDERYMWLALTA